VAILCFPAETWPRKRGPWHPRRYSESETALANRLFFERLVGLCSSWANAFEDRSTPFFIQNLAIPNHPLLPLAFFVEF
jgi:hypothetical protein